MTTARGQAIVGVAAFFLAVNVLAIGSRCYTRLMITKKTDLNDLFMVFCIALYVILMEQLVVGVGYGIGSHTMDIVAEGLSLIEECLKNVLILEVLYVFLTSFMKASIAITFLQRATSSRQRYFLYSAIAIDAIICISVFFATLFQCKPISYQWLKFSSEGECMSAEGFAAVGYALCGITVALDLFFLSFPYFLIKGKGLNSRVKYYVGAVWCLGVMASIANMVRLSALANLLVSVDALYDAADVFIWSVVEVSLGITIAGLLELGPLMQRFGVKGFVAANSSFLEVETDEMSAWGPGMSKGEERVVVKEMEP